MGNRWRAICLCCVDTAVIAMAVLGGVIGIATLVTGLTPSVRFCTFVELYPNPSARSKHYWPLEVVNSATPSPSPSIGDVTAWDVRDLSGFYIPDERTDTWSLRCDLGDIHLVHHWRYATLLSSVTDDLSYDERVSTPGWIPASLLLGLTLIVVALRWKYARGAANADATQHALGDRATPRTCRSRLCRKVLGAVLALGVFTGLAVLATLILAELRVGVTIDLPERIPHLLYARTGVNARDGSVRLHYENETTPGGLMQALPMGTYEVAIDCRVLSAPRAPWKSKHVRRSTQARRLDSAVDSHPPAGVLASCAGVAAAVAGETRPLRGVRGITSTATPPAAAQSAVRLCHLHHVRDEWRMCVSRCEVLRRTIDALLIVALVLGCIAGAAGLLTLVAPNLEPSASTTSYCDWESDELPTWTLGATQGWIELTFSGVHQSTALPSIFPDESFNVSGVVQYKEGEAAFGCFSGTSAELRVAGWVSVLVVFPALAGLAIQKRRRSAHRDRQHTMPVDVAWHARWFVRWGLVGAIMLGCVLGTLSLAGVVLPGRKFVARIRMYGHRGENMTHTWELSQPKGDLAFCSCRWNLPRTPRAAERDLRVLGLIAFRSANLDTMRIECLRFAGWIPPLILIPLPAYWLFAPAWRRGWRRGHGRCVGCGYDLRGDVAGRCPECGARRGDDAGPVGDGGGRLGESGGRWRGRARRIAREMAGRLDRACGGWRGRFGLTRGRWRDELDGSRR